MPRKKQGSLQRRRAQRESGVAVTSQQVEVSEFTSGPLPHPELYGGYEQVLPGSADRIMGMAEEEGRQRRLRKMILTVAVAAAVVAGVSVGGILLYRGEDLAAGLPVLGVAVVAVAFKDLLR